QIEQILGAMTDRNQRLQVEETGAALDRVETAEDSVQKLAVVGRLLQIDQLLLQRLENLASFDQEILNDVVFDIDRHGESSESETGEQVIHVALATDELGIVTLTWNPRSFSLDDILVSLIGSLPIFRSLGRTGDAHQFHQVFLELLHQTDDAPEHLSGQILVILGHQRLGQIAADFRAVRIELLEEIVQLARELPELGDLHLAPAKPLPGVAELLGATGHRFVQRHAVLNGGKRAVGRLLRHRNDVVQALTGIGDVVLGQLRQSAVEP